MKKKTLILGLGNDILTDDGIGPRLVLDLSEMINNPGIQFETSTCGGLEIIENIKGYRKVIFIDAMRSHGGDPGEVLCFAPSDFSETLHLSSLHDINFLTALELGKSLNMDLPSNIHIIAIEIIEDMEFSDELTPQMKEKYPEILRNVFETVKRIIEE